MSHNPYQAPGAVVSDAADVVGVPFYIVSPRKFLWLQLGTFGLYAVYWFYRHWKAQNTQPDRNYWPIPRAIFAIFFTHSLFGEIRRVLDRRGHPSRFRPGVNTAVYLGSVIGGMVVGQMLPLGAPPILTILLGFALLFPVAWALYDAQCAANAACGDEQGVANDGVTAANVVWIVIGTLIWLGNMAIAYTALTRAAALAG